jgi:chemotaxis protein methyltransferase CheR
VTTVAPLSDGEFALFQKLIHEEAGIWLSPAKKDLLVARLRRRVRELELRSFGAYFARLAGGDDAERTRLFDSIATNETRFFREPEQIELVARQVLPRLEDEARAGLRPRRLAVWSAGCATGEEPYTFAMVLAGQLRAAEGWCVELLATDLSTRVLERARAATYPAAQTAQIPDPYLKSGMLKGVRSREGWICVRPEVRRLVRFERHNLCAGAAYPVGPFDLVLCRNVLIYFDPATRDRVIGRLAQCLGPRGLLLLGHAETLGPGRHGLRAVGPLTYERQP